MYDALDYLVDLAGRAPSPLNLQPWRFRARRGGLDLLADPRRVPVATAAEERQMVVACGAALFNLRLALGHLGFEPRVSLLPAGGEPDLLARLEPGAEFVPPELDEALLAAVPQRRTVRAPFADHRRLPSWLVERLVDSAAAEGAVLIVPEAERHDRLDSILALAERLPDAADDEAAALGLRASWSAGGHGGVLAVLCTTGDAPLDWLVAGMALQRLLLTGTTAWVRARFFTMALERTDLRERMRQEVCGGDVPHVVLELGYVATEVRSDAPAARS